MKKKLILPEVIKKLVMFETELINEMYMIHTQQIKQGMT